MPNQTHLSAGSNSTIKSGSGQVYGVIVGGNANGATVFLTDSLSIGATPNFPNQFANGSNLGVIGPVTAAGGSFSMHGAPFIIGLNVAATSNAPVTVIWS